MSHSVTITRTVTSSNTTSTLVLNTGYLRTCPGLLKLAELVNIDLKKILFAFVRRRLTNFVIISDSWSHMCWNRCLSLWSSILLCNTRFILLVDGNNIFDWNILPIGIVLILIKHWWHHFKNHLRKLNTSFSFECFNRNHFMVFPDFHRNLSITQLQPFFFWLHPFICLWRFKTTNTPRYMIITLLLQFLDSSIHYFILSALYLPDAPIVEFKFNWQTCFSSRILLYKHQLISKQ